MKAFKIFVLFLGALSLASATPTPEARENSPQHSEYEYSYDNEAAQPSSAQEPAESASHYDAYIQDVQAAATGGGGGGKKGYSSGSGLRTIAVGSANQAKTALGNQAAAAYQAAYVAKNTLAQSAAQASATAQAALAGKQVILSGLEQQVRDAKVALQGEEMQLQQAKRSAQAAAQAAQQAMHQVNVIQAALNAAQATSENANEAASQAAGELGAQTAMVGAARQRLHTLQEQLHGVRIDFEATQSAARKAQAAAQQAQANAAAAAAKAAAAGLGGSQHDASHEEWSGPIVEVHHVHQPSAKPSHRHHHRNPSKSQLTFELSSSASEHITPNVEKPDESDEIENKLVTAQSTTVHPQQASSNYDSSSPQPQLTFEYTSSESEHSKPDVQKSYESDETDTVSIPAKSQSKYQYKALSQYNNYSLPKPSFDNRSPTTEHLKSNAQRTVPNKILTTPVQPLVHRPLEAYVYHSNFSLPQPQMIFQPKLAAQAHSSLPKPPYNAVEVVSIPIPVELPVRIPIQSYSSYPPRAFINYSSTKPQTLQSNRSTGKHSNIILNTESNKIGIVPVEVPGRLPFKSHFIHGHQAFTQTPQKRPQVANNVDNAKSQTKAFPVFVPYRSGYRYSDHSKRSAGKYNW